MLPPFPNLYCSLRPHAKQQLFLSLDCPEAFFGGAAGGGKSTALLLAALQYVDVPGYAALILRKELQRLALPGGLIPRSHEWLAGKATWNANRRQWTFPHEKGPPATITFGYLARPFDKFRYASSEFQYIAFDELTELREEDYLFLFSRLRRIHSIDARLRIRSASNPGNLGHHWVKQRFVRDWSATGPLPEGIVEHCDSVSGLRSGVLYLDDRAFVPSLIADNPTLDAAEYRSALMHLPPLERERLASGDWTVQERSVFKKDWFLDYVLAGEQYELLRPGGAILATIPQQGCRRFATVDPAGTSDDSDDAARRRHSFSVIQIWDQPQARDLARLLIFRHQYREQCSVHALCKLIESAHGAWKPETIWIEDEKLGHSLKEFLPGLPVQLVHTENKEKDVRAATLANKLEAGEIFLPKLNTTWRLGFERELLAWTGNKRQPCDQIDAAAYAAIVSAKNLTGAMRIQPVVTRS